MAQISPTKPQYDFITASAPYPAFVGGFGCVHPDTKIWTEHGLMRIADITRPMRVVSWNQKDQKFQLSLSGGAFPKGKANLYRVTTQQGEFVSSGHHRIFSSEGKYLPVSGLLQGRLSSASLSRSNLEFGRILSSLGVQRYCQKDVDCLESYANEARLYGQQFLTDQDSGQSSAPSQGDARRLFRYDDFCVCVRMDDLLGQKLEHSHLCQVFAQTYKIRSVLQTLSRAFSSASQALGKLLGRTFGFLREHLQSVSMFFCHRTDLQQLSVSHSLSKSPISSVVLVEEPSPFYDMQVLDTNNYVCESGFIHHNSGKTEALVNRAIYKKAQYPHQNIAFYEPTYDLIRMIAWPRFEEKLTEMGISFRLIKSPQNLIEVDGMGQIIFRSMDTPQRIIGYEVADSFVDELDTLKPADAAYVWRQVIARNRQKKPDGDVNTVSVATTPEGFRFVYDAWRKNPSHGYELIKAPTYSNPYLPQGYVDSLKAIYPEHLLSAYLEGEFVNLVSGTVYRSYNREAHRSTETIKHGEPLFIGMDFNVTKQAATVYVKRNGGKEWHAVDELVDMYDTPEAIRVIKDKYQGHQITIYPDASGKSRKSVDASISDISLLEQAGFKIRAHKTNPGVKDRTNAANSAFERGIIYVNDNRCPNVANCLEQQVYDKNGEPDKKSGNDHQNDATTYPLAYEFPINKPAASLVVKFAR